MENHALNAANEVVKRLFDEGVLGEEVSYDETVAWVANIIAKEYSEPLIGFLKIDPCESLTSALLEFGEGDNGEPAERLIDDW